MIKIGLFLSTGQAGSIEEWPKTDCRHQSVGLVLGSGGDRVCGSVSSLRQSFKSHRHLKSKASESAKIIAEKCKNSPDLHQNRQALITP